MNEELVFPAYYMYVGDGTGHGDILYCKTRDDCKLVYTIDEEYIMALGTELVVHDWSQMQYISINTAAWFGLEEHLKVNSVNELFTNAHAIQQEREEDYGDAQESFDSIADFWSNYLSRKTQLTVELDAIDVALMMNLFKISRNAYKRKEDNFVDGESYANFGTRFFKENYETVS